MPGWEQTLQEKTALDAVVRRRNEEEARRRELTTVGRVKFVGSALFGGLAAAGVAAIALTHGETQAGVIAAEVVSTSGSVGFFGWGMADLHEAADASRNASRLVQVAAAHELNAVGVHGENGAGVQEGNGAQSDGRLAAEGPVHSITSQWLRQEH